MVEENGTQGALVLVTHGAKGTRLSATSPEAQALGLWPGMKLTDARAMIPALDVVTHDEAGDHALQGRLAHWLMRYSPSVTPWGADGFMLDTAGCDHLFGGEAGMAQDITHRFDTMGFATRLAFADTPGAALALVSHGAARVHILPPGHGDDLLDALPVEALRLEEETIILLRRLGLKRIGDVRPLPRTAIERRFRDVAKTRKKTHATAASRALQWRLDQLCGTIAEPISFLRPPPPFRVTLPCPDLALEPEAVGEALSRLLPPLMHKLAAKGVGGRHLALTGYRADGGVSTVSVRLSAPTRDADLVTRLFAEKLPAIDCGYGIDLFVLVAIVTEGLEGEQQTMTGAGGSETVGGRAIAAFADIVDNRVGERRVTRLVPRTSHVPERAQQTAAVTLEPGWEEFDAARPVRAPRPLRLFTRPEPAKVTAELPDSPPVQFIWRRRLRRVVRARGPECIMPEWWHDNLKPKPSAVFRDYYDVEDEEGLRYWMFRAIRQEKVAGEDEEMEPEEEAEPESVMRIDWYVHGLF